MPSSAQASAPDAEPKKPAFEQARCVCPEHGAYHAYRSVDGSIHPVNDCPTCIDAAAAERDAERRARDQRQMRERKLKELFGAAGIPPRFANRSFANYDAPLRSQKIALAICSAYAENWPEQYRKGGSLVLTGKPGTGKTHLACAIANRIMPEHLASVGFGEVSKFLRGVKSTYGGKSDRSETQAMADLLLPDLLIVDEVGTSTGSEHEKQLLFEIFNGRYQNLRPTIVISNLNGEDLEKELGQRVMDRFRECGSIVAFDWESHRGQQVEA